MLVENLDILKTHLNSLCKSDERSDLTSSNFLFVSLIHLHKFFEYLMLNLCQPNGAICLIISDTVDLKPLTFGFWHPMDRTCLGSGGFLLKSAADALWSSLQTQGWKRLEAPAWGAASDV